MNRLKISIVTPTYNQGKYIEQTIDSVLSQDYDPLEYIIIDGGSTDDTLEIIRKYKKYLKYWISKPDRGQAHAINKGLHYCTGEIFNWLNSDDYLAENALEAISESFVSSSADAVAGQTIFFQDDNFQDPIQLSKLSPEGLIHWLPGVRFVQPGLWLKRENISKCGGLNEDLHYAFDTDMVIRYLALYPNVQYVAEKLVFFRLHKGSKTVSSPEQFETEKEIYLNALLINEQFEGLKNIADAWLRKHNWSQRLKEIISSYDRPVSAKIFSIIGGMMQDPKFRWNRKSIGTIKKLLFES